MKKIFISGTLLLLTLITVNVNAQTEKGDWMVGGQMSFNTTSGDKSFTLAPSAGYFFANNFAAGSEFLLSFSKIEDKKESAVGVGPFARYYFELKEPAFKPFVHTSFTLANETTKVNDVKTSSTKTSFFIGAGGAYFINSNVALEGVMGYNNTKVENLSAKGGFLFRVGFQIHLLSGEIRTKK